MGERLPEVAEAFPPAGEAFLLFQEASPRLWQQTDLLLVPPGVTGRTDFGNAMAMDDRFFFIGAMREDTRGIPNEPGAVYAYRWAKTGSPELVQELEPGPVDYGPSFGFSLAIEGDTLVVGEAEGAAALVFVQPDADRPARSLVVIRSLEGE